MDEQYGSHFFFNHITVYFWDETSFSFTFHAEKVSNEKLQFQVTKRDKKLYEQLF